MCLYFILFTNMFINIICNLQLCILLDFYNTLMVCERTQAMMDDII